MGTVFAILAIFPWWPSQFSIMMAVLLVLITCTIAYLSFVRIGWLGGRRRLQRVLWTGEGEWRLFDATGSWLATLRPNSQSLGSLLWLRFASERGPRELLLFSWDLAPTLRRQLVTRLKLQAGAKGRPDGTGDLS
jgi:hypothetical protein